MKKIFITAILFVSIKAISQVPASYLLYAERKNTDNTIDSFYVRDGRLDTVFNKQLNFVSLTGELYKILNLEAPGAFSNYHKGADNIWRNYVPRANEAALVDWAGVSNKPSTVTNLSGTNTGDNATNTQYSGLAASKANINSPTFTGTVSGITAAMVGLGNVTNESKATMFTNPAFTGTPTGITATHVGLGNVNNTSDAAKPVSTAQQTALDLKQNISGNNGGWNVLRVSGSNATTTGQTLVDITGLVTPTLTNATLYEVEAVLYVSTTAVTTGTQYAFTANGTGGAATVFINVSGTTTTNAATTVTQSASGAAIGTFLTTSGSSGIIVLRGYILTRGSGTATIALQHLKVTSGTSTVLIGSKFQYRLAQ